MSSDADLPRDLWTTEDVAAYLDVGTSTIRAYLARRQMPEPDRRIGRMAVWKPATIRRWAEQRRRKASADAGQDDLQGT